MHFHRPNYDPKFKEAVFKAATRMGYKMVDSNGEKQTGNENAFRSDTFILINELRQAYAFSPFSFFFFLIKAFLNIRLLYETTKDVVQLKRI